jgi:beta-glucosidase
MKLKLIYAAVALTVGAASIKAQQVPAYLDQKQPIEVRVKDALSRMSLEEKVKLCTAQSKFSSHGVPRLGIPELWMSDSSSGIREEIQWDNWGNAGFTNDSCTAFPALTCLAATWNPRMSSIFGKAIGEEARYRRKDVLLGPGVNIFRTPLNGRNVEYMGEDPYLASTMVVPYVKGVQSNGVAACVKHYALNNQEVLRGNIDVELSDRALNEIYLPAFKAAIVDGGCWSIMGAYNKVRGEHACHNDFLLNKILKGEWKFDGCVISDWGGAHDTKEAVLNGLDIEMGSYTNGLSSGKKFAYDNYYLAADYLKGLKDGTYPMSTIDDKASRILRLIFRTAMNSDRPWGSFTSEEHYNVARTIAEEGIVLLKNEANKKKEMILPLDGNKYRSILVVGENATRGLCQAGGSSFTLKVKDEISPLAGLQAKYGDKIKYSKGYAAGKPTENHAGKLTIYADSLRAEAVKQAADADVVVFVGGLNKDRFQDSESTDRESIALPFGQNELINEMLKVNKNIIVVLISGNAVEMPWVKSVPSIVQAWYLGTESGNAIANVLSGEVNPSGKLPFSFPVKLTDNGAHSFGTIAYPGDGVKEVYKEDILVGYRWHDTKKIPALFPFGYGLSYTQFKYGKAVVDKKNISGTGEITVTIPIKNVGTVKGKEVVQLYIGDEKCSVIRPVKELKDFQKIELAPGEEKIVSFKIGKDALKFFNETSHDWIVEPGVFKVYIGSSSTDIRSIVNFVFN